MQRCLVKRAFLPCEPGRQAGFDLLAAGRLLRPVTATACGAAPGDRSGSFGARRLRRGFTLIELLIVVAIIGLLVSILLPSLSAGRAQARGTKCLAQLRSLAQGMTLYATEERGLLIPGRLPRVDNCNWQLSILGRLKYRPNFLAMMSAQIGIPCFDDPKACRNEIDSFGERGDQQNYSSPLYVCPEVPDWTDERNSSYGYNYQFLGNSRLRDESDIFSFKNWPVSIDVLLQPSRTVAVADCMGTAASFPTAQRQPYENNSRDADRFGNEGFNLDPPRVDPVDGEMAGFEEQHRTAADDRHRGRASVLFVDGHGQALSLKELGYRFNADGSIALDGENMLWTGDGRDVAWTPQFRHGQLPAGP